MYIPPEETVITREGAAASSAGISRRVSRYGATTWLGPARIAGQEVDHRAAAGQRDGRGVPEGGFRAGYLDVHQLVLERG